jgi:hypothetical protein
MSPVDIVISDDASAGITDFEIFYS